MAEKFYTILTKVGKAKIANNTALGTRLNLVKFQLGDGGGSYYNPTEEQEQLKNKVWEGNISSITVDKENPNWIVLEVIIPHDVGGFMIREAGVFDDSGNLMAIGKYPETYKPVVGDGSTKDLVIKMILEVSNTSSVTLKVDATTILATKKDIENVEQKVDIKLKTVDTTVEKLNSNNKEFITKITNAEKEIENKLIKENDKNKKELDKTVDNLIKSKNKPDGIVMLDENGEIPSNLIKIQQGCLVDTFKISKSHQVFKQTVCKLDGQGVKPLLMDTTNLKLFKEITLTKDISDPKIILCKDKIITFAKSSSLGGVIYRIFNLKNDSFECIVTIDGFISKISQNSFEVQKIDDKRLLISYNTYENNTFYNKISLLEVEDSKLSIKTTVIIDNNSEYTTLRKLNVQTFLLSSSNNLVYKKISIEDLNVTVSEYASNSNIQNSLIKNMILVQKNRMLCMYCNNRGTYLVNIDIQNDKLKFNTPILISEAASQSSYIEGNNMIKLNNNEVIISYVSANYQIVVSIINLNYTNPQIICSKNIGSHTPVTLVKSNDTMFIITREMSGKAQNYLSNLKIIRDISGNAKNIDYGNIGKNALFCDLKDIISYEIPNRNLVFLTARQGGSSNAAWANKIYKYEGTYSPFGVSLESKNELENCAVAYYGVITHPHSFVFNTPLYSGYNGVITDKEEGVLIGTALNNNKIILKNMGVI